MNLAIKKAAAAKIDVKKKLGKSLITTFNELQNDFYAENNEAFEKVVRENFSGAQAVLQ